MIKKPWSNDEIKQLKQLKQEGYTNPQISEILDRSKASVRNKVNALLADDNLSPEKLPVDKFQKASEQEKCKRVEVTSEYEDTWNDADEWKYAADRNREQIQKVRTRSRFNANFGNHPVGISFISDQHITKKGAVDMHQMLEDAQLIARTPNLYCCLGGDGVNNHIKHLSAMISDESNPADEYRLFDYYLNILQDSIMVLITGNHSWWTQERAGVDMIGWTCCHRKIQYGKHEAFLKVNVGGQDYRLAWKHKPKNASMYNDTHGVKQWLRFFESDDLFDIGCMCHHHVPAMEHGRHHGKDRVYIRPGSYQITTDYSQINAYPSTVPKCPTVVLYPGTRKMVPFLDVKDAARFLTYENNQ